MLFDRQKSHADRIFARRREGEAEGFALTRKKLVGDLDQQSGAVARLRITAAGPAVRQVDQNLNSLLDNLVTLLATNAGDKPDATRVVFMRRIVKTLWRRQTVACLPAMQKYLLRAVVVG